MVVSPRVSTDAGVLLAHPTKAKSKKMYFIVFPLKSFVEMCIDCPTYTLAAWRLVTSVFFDFLFNPLIVQLWQVVSDVDTVFENKDVKVTIGIAVFIFVPSPLDCDFIPN
jgi:hypothetical protein